MVLPGATQERISAVARRGRGARDGALRSIRNHGQNVIGAGFIADDRIVAGLAAVGHLGGYVLRAGVVAVEGVIAGLVAIADFGGNIRRGGIVRKRLYRRASLRLLRIGASS